ncbi:MAG: hypothetical protein BGP05_21545 [Rhizobiales bacterium 62-47]|nr:MAG: hypothetical protein BGP05_21545 [Rhizobiales bacterium 62-47]
MRIPAGLLTLWATGMAFTAVTPTSVRADTDYPVCLHVYGPVTYDECRYTSIAQCTPAAVGRPASCMINPFYAGPNVPPRRKPRYNG